MKFQQALEHALDGDALLFLGAGFSLGSKNGRGELLKLGSALAKHLAAKANVSLDSELQDAAEEFVDLRGPAELSKNFWRSFEPQRSRSTTE